MRPRIVLVRAPDPDGRALARRLLGDEGIAEGALMISRADVMAIVVEAKRAGARMAVAGVAETRFCRVCGCTDLSTCQPADPCHWVASDLCSACEPFVRRLPL